MSGPKTVLAAAVRIYLVQARRRRAQLRVAGADELARLRLWLALRILHRCWELDIADVPPDFALSLPPSLCDLEPVQSWAGDPIDYSPLSRRFKALRLVLDSFYGALELLFLAVHGPWRLEPNREKEPGREGRGITDFLSDEGAVSLTDARRASLWLVHLRSRVTPRRAAWGLVLDADGGDAIKFSPPSFVHELRVTTCLSRLTANSAVLMKLAAFETWTWFLQGLRWAPRYEALQYQPSSRHL
ncbi:hypothetical protein AURDEDRAFT_168136 [Auricularia subglabra TFB-10046 SS5]|nr:hypothetical protein AURDEDRAFT_168136 [Auricularia subglabra TFB-10046 SS5]